MPVTYQVEDRFLWYKIEGNNTIGETLEQFKAGLADPKFRPGLNILVDARQSLEKRSRNELAGLADFFGSRAPLIGFRCALLINENNRDQEGYERFLASLTDRYKMEFFVFFSHEDAITWLSTA